MRPLRSFIAEHGALLAPFYEYVLAQLRTRFPDTPENSPHGLQQLLPQFRQCGQSDAKLNILAAAKLYMEDLDVPEKALDAEITQWLSVKVEQPQDFRTCYMFAQRCGFPSIKKLLQVFGCLPVTNAQCERSFSELRRLKTFMRTTMSDERLSGLALLHVHKDIAIDTDSVLTAYRSDKNRRVLL